MKKCNKCELIKELSEFHKSKDGAQGVRAICKECIRKCDREFYDRNKEIIKPKKIIYQRGYKQKLNLSFLDNPEIKIKRNMYSYLRRFINDLKMSDFIKYIGISFEDYKEYLECQFNNDMNWSNYGLLWNIDHIIPLSKVDFKKEENKYKIINYRNTRVIYSKDNTSKSNKRLTPLYDIIGVSLLNKILEKNLIIN